MERLPFKLPDFFRLNWVSESARGHWEPILGKCRSLIPTLESESVKHGLRRCALIPVPMAEIETFISKTETAGMSSMELYRFFGASGYSSEATLSKPNMAMIAIGSKLDTNRIKECSDSGDTSAIGEYLGYPACCRRFFQETWNEQRYIDTTWPMGVNTVTAQTVNGTHIQIKCASTNNMLLRWMGVRPVFHLPCSFDCADTSKIASELHELAKSADLAEQMNSMHEILDWPVRWSALHGIAEIETPVFRLSTKTDASSKKYSIDKLASTQIVQHQAFGLRFPYSWPKSRSGVEKRLRSSAELHVLE